MGQNDGGWVRQPEGVSQNSVGATDEYISGGRMRNSVVTAHQIGGSPLFGWGGNNFVNRLCVVTRNTCLLLYEYSFGREIHLRIDGSTCYGQTLWVSTASSVGKIQLCTVLRMNV